MNCPKCGGECWDNTVNKKNPKGPDYKCKVCGHAVWLNHKAETPKPAANTPAPSNGNGSDILKTKAMILAYAKDLEIARIQAGIGAPEPVKEIICTFNELWMAIK